ncbi:unnamed protein product [Vitrella brassicaformis CCMP3155]|uniref:Protein kinase domain-containing protein n=3 Tax=Vitrella brassicaformis TaxID=1169539 RepID=A0A0G4EZM8_VITBC|nr:unnamed protein product [Vitrella brassicaformis CCMP3155]|eukprot:CEM04273.1 unnamed protein product [Vitrella brassicaformis CCMP3155]
MTPPTSTDHVNGKITFHTRGTPPWSTQKLPDMPAELVLGGLLGTGAHGRTFEALLPTICAKKAKEKPGAVPQAQLHMKEGAAVPGLPPPWVYRLIAVKVVAMHESAMKLQMSKVEAKRLCDVVLRWRHAYPNEPCPAPEVLFFGEGRWERPNENDQLVYCIAMEYIEGEKLQSYLRMASTMLHTLPPLSLLSTLKQMLHVTHTTLYLHRKLAAIGLLCIDSTFADVICVFEHDSSTDGNAADTKRERDGLVPVRKCRIRILDWGNSMDMWNDVHGVAGVPQVHIYVSPYLAQQSAVGQFPAMTPYKTAPEKALATLENMRRSPSILKQHYGYDLTSDEQKAIERQTNELRKRLESLKETKEQMKTDVRGEQDREVLGNVSREIRELKREISRIEQEPLVERLQSIEKRHGGYLQALRREAVHKDSNQQVSILYSEKTLVWVESVKLSLILTGGKGFDGVLKDEPEWRERYEEVDAMSEGPQKEALSSKHRLLRAQDEFNRLLSWGNPEYKDKRTALAVLLDLSLPPTDPHHTGAYHPSLSQMETREEFTPEVLEGDEKKAKKGGKGKGWSIMPLMQRADVRGLDAVLCHFVRLMHDTTQHLPSKRPSMTQVEAAYQEGYRLVDQAIMLNETSSGSSVPEPPFPASPVTRLSFYFPMTCSVLRSLLPRHINPFPVQIPLPCAPLPPFMQKAHSQANLLPVAAAVRPPAAQPAAAMYPFPPPPPPGAGAVGVNIFGGMVPIRPHVGGPAPVYLPAAFPGYPACHPPPRTPGRPPMYMWQPKQPREPTPQPAMG